MRHTPRTDAFLVAQLGQGLNDGARLSDALDLCRHMERQLGDCRALLSEAMVALHHVYVSMGRPEGARPFIDKLAAALAKDDPAMETVGAK